MQIPKRSLRYLWLAFVAISLLLYSGCATPRDPRAGVAYEPVRCPSQISASATVNVTVTNTPELAALAKQFGNNEAYLSAMNAAQAEALRNDLATSGLFARVVADNEQADYNVKLEWRWKSANGRRAYEAVLTAVKTKTAESATATVKFEWQQPWIQAIPAFPVGLRHVIPPMDTEEKVPDVMAALKTTLAKRVLAQEQIATFPKASLPELIASSDANSACAAARNRALIAAKVQQLPALLRDRKTDELSALVVKIEQTELDLNHESEMAKDRAQQMAAENGAAPQIAELRGLAISYQDRIELLKPIAVALKEEIANRNR